MDGRRKRPRATVDRLEEAADAIRRAHSALLSSPPVATGLTDQVAHLDAVSRRLAAYSHDLGRRCRLLDTDDLYDEQGEVDPCHLLGQAAMLLESCRLDEAREKLARVKVRDTTSSESVVFSPIGSTLTQRRTRVTRRTTTTAESTEGVNPP